MGDYSSKSKDIPWNCGKISSNPNITWENVQLNLDKYWDFDYLSCHPNITWNIIQSNLYKPLDDLSSYSTIYVTWSNRLKWHLKFNWNWIGISCNPNITWDIIQSNPDEPWNWFGISCNPNINWDIIEANPNNVWDWIGICENSMHLAKNIFIQKEMHKYTWMNKLTKEIIAYVWHPKRMYLWQNYI